MKQHNSLLTLSEKKQLMDSLEKLIHDNGFDRYYSSDDGSALRRMLDQEKLPHESLAGQNEILGAFKKDSAGNGEKVFMVVTTRVKPNVFTYHFHAGVMEIANVPVNVMKNVLKELHFEKA